MSIEEKKRYVVTESYYMYADNDTDALYKAKHRAAAQSRKYDNMCAVQEVGEVPFGKIGAYRKIEAA